MFFWTQLLLIAFCYTNFQVSCLIPKLSTHWSVLKWDNIRHRRSIWLEKIAVADPIHSAPNRIAIASSPGSSQPCHLYEIFHQIDNFIRDEAEKKFGKRKIKIEKVAILRLDADGLLPGRESKGNGRRPREIKRELL